jgi:uncharacterized membrane protein (UPF0136 family)
MGYMKKGSQKSVIAGVTTGAMLLAAAHLMGTAASFKVGVRLAFGARHCVQTVAPSPVACCQDHVFCKDWHQHLLVSH